MSSTQVVEYEQESKGNAMKESAPFYKTKKQKPELHHDESLLISCECFSFSLILLLYHLLQSCLTFTSRRKNLKDIFSHPGNCSSLKSLSWMLVRYTDGRITLKSSNCSKKIQCVRFDKFTCFKHSAQHLSLSYPLEFLITCTAFQVCKSTTEKKMSFL